MCICVYTFVRICIFVFTTKTRKNQPIPGSRGSGPWTPPRNPWSTRAGAQDDGSSKQTPSNYLFILKHVFYIKNMFFI